MLCNQPNVIVPVDFQGQRLNIKIDALGKKVWVCIDEQSVFRAQHLGSVTIEDDRTQFEKESLQAVLERQAEQGNPLLTVLQGAVSRLEDMTAAARSFFDQARAGLSIPETMKVLAHFDDQDAFIEELQVAGLCREMIVKVQRPISTNDPNMEEGVCLVYNEDQSLNQFIQIGQAMEWFNGDFKMYVRVRFWNDGVLQIIARTDDQPW